MIKVSGEKLRQYDLNRTVEIIPKHGHTVETVYFSRGPEPLAVAHREEGGKIIADFPNILLKTFGTLAVECHLTDEDGYHISEQTSFYVSKREMPIDYAYEETPVLKLGSDGGTLPEGVPCVKTVYDEWGAFTMECVGGQVAEKFDGIRFYEDGEVTNIYDGNKAARLLKADKQYRCVFDGVEYTLTAIGNSLGAYVGKKVATDSTDCPFYYSTGDTPDDAFNQAFRVYVYDSTPGTHTLSIAEIKDEVHPIDVRCLPTEEWTFTLEDDSTVTKKVVVAE